MFNTQLMFNKIVISYIYIFVDPVTCPLTYTKGSYGTFTFDVKSVLNENVGGILGGTEC
jgi:hypothetical protein